MRIVILDAATLGADVDLAPLVALGEVKSYDGTERDLRFERCREADVVIANKVCLDAELIGQCTSTGLISVAATGTNNVDLDAARRHKIAVTNVAGYSTASVVQHTLAMVLWQGSNHARAHEHVVSGDWERCGLFTWLDQPFDELAGKRWGIIGLGAIGRGVARAVSALGCDVFWSSVSGSQRAEAWPRLELEALLATCDIISLHAPLTQESRGILGPRELALMPAGARLYNLARGGLVDEAALAAAIQSGQIAAAGLDVFVNEPLSADSPLLAINDSQRLLLTPHIAWSSRQARQRLIEGMAENIAAWRRGERRNRVD